MVRKMKLIYRLLIYLGGLVLSPLIAYVVKTTLAGQHQWTPFSIIVLVAAMLVLFGFVLYIDWRLAVSSLNQSLGHFCRVKDIPFGSLISKYKDYYWESPEDRRIREQLRQQRRVLIAGKPIAGKTRAALEAIRAVVPGRSYFLSPTAAESSDIKGLRIPRFMFFLGPKPSVIIFFDDLSDYVKRLPASLLKQRVESSAQPGRVWIVATCRRGKELSLVSDDPTTKELFKDFGAPIELEDIDEKTGTNIRGAVGERSLKVYFDGTRGSVVLGIATLKEAYNSLALGAKSAMKSLRVLRMLGQKKWTDSTVWGVSETILGATVDVNLRIQALEDLAEKELVFVTEQSKRTELECQHDIYLSDDFMGVHDSFGEWKSIFGGLERYFSEKCSAEKLVLVGRLYYVNKDYRKAEEVYSICTKINEEFAEAYEYAAYLQFEEGRFEEAEQTLRECLARTKDHNQQARILLVVGNILFAKQYNVEGAAEKVARAIDLATDPGTKLQATDRYGDLLLSTRQFVDAEAYYLHADASGANQEPKLRVQVRADLVTVLLAQNKTEEATKWLMDLAPYADENGLVAEAWTRILVRISDLFEDVPSRVTDCNQVCLGALSASLSREVYEKRLNAIALGVLHEGKLIQAARIYASMTESVVTRQEKIVALINLGATLRDNENYQVATSKFQLAKDLAQEAPSSPAHEACAIAGLADCSLLAENDLRKAEQLYETAKILAEKVSDPDGLSWALMGIGDVSLSRGQPVKAEEYYRKALTLTAGHSGQTRVLLGLGRALIEQRKFEDAEYRLRLGKDSSKYPARLAKFKEALDELERLKAPQEQGTSSSRGTLS